MKNEGEPGKDDASRSAEALDIGPDNGRRPPFATPIQRGLGTVGTGSGYSGQEYDAAGQDEWRAEQERRNLPADGEVRGSGAGAGGGDPGEDFDIATPGGATPAGTSGVPTARGDEQ